MQKVSTLFSATKDALQMKNINEETNHLVDRHNTDLTYYQFGISHFILKKWFDNCVKY